MSERTHARGDAVPADSSRSNEATTSAAATGRPFESRALGASAQDGDAKRQIVCQSPHEPDFVRNHGVGFRVINEEDAEHLAVFVLEGQGDSGAVAMLQSAFAPGSHPWVGFDFLNIDDFTTLDGLSGGASPAFRVV